MKYFLTFSIFSILSVSFLQAQVKGNIKDATTREQLAGVSIVLKGSQTGSISDLEGSFLFAAQAGDTLVFSHIGYQSQEQIVPPSLLMEIALIWGGTLLGEVVVTGYGSQQRKDVTGAIVKITSKEFNAGSLNNPMQQIQGKVAGLVIVQPGGDPNGEFTVRLRGAASLEGQAPLVVIDGVAIEDFHRALATLNPADVESYDILKDASAAAIYGSRGANGVILISTKSGKFGKTSVEYHGFAGVENGSNFLNLLTAAQWREATAANGGSGLDKGADIDWQKAITRTAKSQSHNLGISGGSAQFNYRGSLGYIRQEGILQNNGKEVISTRLSANQKSLHDKLDIRYGINTSSINRDFLPDQLTTSLSRTGGSGIFRNTLGFLPVWPVQNPDGSYYQTQDQNLINPLAYLNEIYSKQKENFVQTSVKADYQLLRGLKAGVLGALSKATQVYDYFNPGTADASNQSSASKRNTNQQNVTGDLHAHYQKQFHKHHLDFTAVYEYNKFLNDGFGAGARGFLVPQLLNNNLGANTDVRSNDLFSYKNEVKLISFLGRLGYNYDDRYLFSANFRRDGSSKFGNNHRWGNFPSMAVAWRAKNEKFLQSVAWLNELKFRVSYGLTGNQENIPPYPFQLLYGPTVPYYYNNEVFQSYAVTQENNPDLKWEVRKSFNIGFDFTILKNRLSGTLDYFYDRTEDMLFRYALPQPPFLTNSVTANAANALNKGVEITVNATFVKNSPFSWDARFNLGTLENRITNLSGKFKGVDLTIDNFYYGYADGRGLSGAYISKLEVGYPAGVFWLPEHAGLNEAGQELFNNYDSSGQLIGTSTEYTDQDRVYIDPTPAFTWGLTNNFSWGNFDFSFFFRGVQGQKIFANSLMVLETVTRLPGSNVTLKALSNGFTNQPQPSTYWLRDASFARLENLSLGYHFNQVRGFKELGIYLQARNLLVITDYEGLDPEIRVEGSQRYIDNNYYPKTRSITLGINVGF